MKKVEIRGIIPPIVTPMNEGETINEGELRNQISRQTSGGVRGLSPLRTDGEGCILSEAEKEQMLSIVINETKGHVPVYAGIECINTRDTIRQSGMAKPLGAGVLSITTLSFAAASQNELYEHYEAVAKMVDMPIVLYNIPVRTDNPLAPATVARLSKIENIMGAKDGSGGFDSMLQYIEQTRENGDFAVLSSNDSLILWNLLAGGADDIAGCTSIFPEVMASIYNSFVVGDLESVREARDSIWSFRACFKCGNPNTVMRTVVALLGYPVGKCHAPFDQVPEEGIEALEKILAENHEKGTC